MSKHKHWETTIKKYISIPIIVGIAASAAIYTYFGGEELFKTLLSWTVGVTIVVTFVAALAKGHEKKKPF